RVKHRRHQALQQAGLRRLVASRRGRARNRAGTLPPRADAGWPWAACGPCGMAGEETATTPFTAHHSPRTIHRAPFAMRRCQAHCAWKRSAVGRRAAIRPAARCDANGAPGMLIAVDATAPRTAHAAVGPVNTVALLLPAVAVAAGNGV